MELNKSDSCKECTYYTDTIGKNGYCKLYRHNISTPEVMCPKFEQKDNKGIKDINFDIKSVVLDLQKSIKLDRKSASKRALLVASVCSCIVFSVFAIIFAITIAITVMSFNTVDLTTRVIFIITVSVFLISFIVLSYMLVYRFVTMRILYLAASTLSVIYMLMNYNTLWFNFHGIILRVLETVFNIAY